jgi:hypothetical protein
MKLEFSQENYKKYLNIKFHENCPVGAELLHADRQTDMIKLNSNFSQFCDHT